MEKSNFDNVRHVGYAAGRQIIQLGSVSDVELFFSCIPFAALHHQDKPWEILLDRLYRKYLRPEDLDPSLELMNIVKTWAYSQPTTFVDWSQFKSGESGLDHNAPNLGVVLFPFFYNFENCVDSAKFMIEKYGFGELSSVVRLVITDMGDFIKYEQERPFADYDKLARNATPFWALPYDELDRQKNRVPS